VTRRQAGPSDHHVANVRRHFLHQVSNELAKTHDRLVIENLNVSGMLAKPPSTRAISDVGWAEFARQLGYKQAWRAATNRSRSAGTRRASSARPRWHPGDLTLADGCSRCACGHSADRDWQRRGESRPLGQKHLIEPRTPSNGAGHQRPPTGRRLTSTSTCAGETSPVDAGTDVRSAPAD